MKIEKPTKSRRLELRNIPQNETIVMKHKWRNLLFIHWSFDPQEIQKTLPEGLYVDTFNKKAYVGVVPFFLYDVRPVFIPPIPFLSDFLEVNVRTYVYDKTGTPAVYFYSLDANQPVAVKLAQQLHLPYKHAEINAIKNEITNEFTYRIKRKNTPDSMSSEFRYTIKDGNFFPDSESLEFFLVERYLLFGYDSYKKKLISIRVYHKPYSLSDCELIKFDDNMLKLEGFSINNRQPDHVVMSSGADVNIYNLRKVHNNE